MRAALWRSTYSGSLFRVQFVVGGKSRLHEPAAVAPAAPTVKGQTEDEVEPVLNSLPSSLHTAQDPLPRE